MQAIVVRRLGGPEVMTWTSLPTPEPGPGQALVRTTAIGVNFMDTGVRSTPTPGWEPPFGLGVEGAGRIEALGEGVQGLAVGDRVAWCYQRGSYADHVLARAENLVPLPDFLSDETAAAVMMQGLTANGFTTEAHPVAPGETAVVHAAAGGLGLLLTQLVTARGGSVIGVVSREEKAAAARAAGAAHVLVGVGGDFAARVRELTGGEGADVVYDGGGSATFASSLEALRPYGTLAYYGPFMGVPTLTPTDLPRSVRLGYPRFLDHVRTRELLLRRSGEVFGLLESGRLRVRIGGRYPLAEAARAHRDLASRRTTGKLLLLP